MAVPKKRKSKARSRTARAGKRKINIIALTNCPNCSVPHMPHRVCGNCGYYNGRIHKLKAHANTSADAIDLTEQA